jgi:membrane-bound ClpP family serine protease
MEDMEKRKQSEMPGALKLAHLVGEIGCVTKNIAEKKPGLVRILGEDYYASSTHETARGRWVRVISAEDQVLNVSPLNIWLGSCCC